MNPFPTNVVTHYPTQSLGTLFKNPINTTDPNIYVLFSGHVCRTDEINATFLNFRNITLTAKILNVNIWTDVAVAVIQDPSLIDYPIISKIIQDPIFQNNQIINYFSNYQLNNALVLLISSNVRDPNYRFPQEINNFFYPESILLREGQGVVGVSGSPIVNTNNEVVGMISKIVGDENIAYSPNMPNNLVCTKSSMFYLYLFDPVNGLINMFYKFYQANPTVLNDFNLLVSFRNSFNIIINHIGFFLRSYRDITSSARVNLDPSVNGLVLSYRVTGVNKITYALSNYLQKNDPDVQNFTTLLDNSDILNYFYKNKAFVLIKTLTYTDRLGVTFTLNLGVDSIVRYYVNGDPSKDVTMVYTVNSPSGPGGINMTFSEDKTITVKPILVTDEDKSVRYSSQLPKLFTSTTSRSNIIMSPTLFNYTMGMMPYVFNFAVMGSKNARPSPTMTPRDMVRFSYVPNPLDVGGMRRDPMQPRY